jgi:tetratricopeptide (TPR) repeat protein
VDTSPFALSRLGWHRLSWHTVALGMLLWGAMLWVYWPALEGELLWDDNDQFASVPQLQSRWGLIEVWSPVGTAQYYPLSLSLFWVWRQLFDPAETPLPYHLLNLALHMSNVALLWYLLARIDRRFAWLGAALFGLHPVVVPAVAWMCQLRNVLSLHFALWTVVAWDRFEQTANRRAYWWSIGLFLAALLSKTAVAPLPMALWLMYTAAKPRAGRLLQMAPLFALGIGLSSITVVYEFVGGGNDPSLAAPWSERIARMGFIGWYDLALALLVRPPAFVHVRWPIDTATLATYLPTLLGIAFLMGLVLWDWKQRTGAGIAILCYFVMLFPVLGLFNVIFMRYAWVADHWQYPALPFLAVALVLGVKAADRWRIPVWARWISLIALLTLATWQARTFAATFRNQATVWEDTLVKNPNSWMAHNNYGVWLADRGEADKARLHFDRAHEIEPENTLTLFNLGKSEKSRGNAPGAERFFRRALERDPALHDVRNSLVSLYLQQQRYDDAATEAQQIIAEAAEDGSLERMPKIIAMAHNNLGAAWLSQNRATDAAQEFSRSIELDPQLYPARSNLVQVLMRGQQIPDALPHFEWMVRQKPEDSLAWFGLGCCYGALGKAREAVQAYRQALAIRPDWSDPANNLAVVLATHPDPQLRQPDEAVHWAERASAAKQGQDPMLLDTLMLAYLAAGRLADAQRVGNQALALLPTLTGDIRVRRIQDRLRQIEATGAGGASR